MIKTLAYIIEESISSIELSKFVMQKLNDGYELFGTPFIKNGQHDQYCKMLKSSICQCMVKVDKSDELKKVQQVLNSFVDMEKKQNPLRTIDEKGDEIEVDVQY